MADLTSIIGWVVGSVGIGGAFVAAVANFRKTGSEKTGLLVDAAQDVVIIQKGLLADLQSRLDKAEQVIDAMRFVQSEVEHLRLEVDRVHKENAALKAENTRLKKRLKALEDGE